MLFHSKQTSVLISGSYRFFITLQLFYNDIVFTPCNDLTITILYLNQTKQDSSFTQYSKIFGAQNIDQAVKVKYFNITCIATCYIGIIIVTDFGAIKRVHFVSKSNFH